MNGNPQMQLLDTLIRKYLQVRAETELRDDTEIAGLKAADWRIIDLAIEVESEFGVDLSADIALSLKTIGDWRALVRGDRRANA